MKRHCICALWCLLVAGSGYAAAPVQTPECFGDAQWQALQRDSAARKMGGRLVYVWSPRMVLSVQHAHEVQAVAQALDMHFVPLHDGRVPPDEVQAALAALPQSHSAAELPLPAISPLQASQPLCAPSLIAQDAYRHFPTAWVVWAGRVHPLPLVSAMPPAYWRMGITQRLQALYQQTHIRANDP